MIHIIIILGLIFIVVPICAWIIFCIWHAIVDPFVSLWKLLRSVSIDDLRYQITRTRARWIKHG